MKNTIFKNPKFFLKKINELQQTNNSISNRLQEANLKLKKACFLLKNF